MHKIAALNLQAIKPSRGGAISCGVTAGLYAGADPAEDVLPIAIGQACARSFAVFDDNRLSLYIGHGTGVRGAAVSGGAIGGGPIWGWV